jgi:hypothetical protein
MEATRHFFVFAKTESTEVLMSHLKPRPRQQNRLGIRASSRCSAKKRSPTDSENTPVSTRISVPFQFFAHFQVEVAKATEFLGEPDLSPQARSLFLAIIHTPEALNRICHVAILCDRTEESGNYFKGKLTGLDREDILDGILPHLPVELQEYWIGLRRENSASYDFYVDRIFHQFQSSLRKIDIINMSTGESISLWVNGGMQAAS